MIYHADTKEKKAEEFSKFLNGIKDLQKLAPL